MDIDFDEEARALWARLNIDKNSLSGNHWNAVDPIWRHPTTKGTIYVGNQTAAQNLGHLQSLGISHVVNCTGGSSASQIPNYHMGTLKYYVFPVT